MGLEDRTDNLTEEQGTKVGRLRNYLKEHPIVRRVTYGLIGLALIETAAITTGIMVERSFDKAFNTSLFTIGLMIPDKELKETDKTYTLEDRTLQLKQEYIPTETNPYNE